MTARLVWDGYLVDFAARLATQKHAKARSERSSCTDFVLVRLGPKLVAFALIGWSAARHGYAIDSAARVAEEVSILVQYRMMGFLPPSPPTIVSPSILSRVDTALRLSALIASTSGRQEHRSRLPRVECELFYTQGRGV
jgi:hypothetical protein